VLVEGSGVVQDDERDSVCVIKDKDKDNKRHPKMMYPCNLIKRPRIITSDDLFW
jgi:hypothetical protein